MTRARNCVLWNYFERSEDDSGVATCNFCQKTLSFKSTIGNLKKHLRLKHLSTYNELTSSGLTDPDSISTYEILNSSKATEPEHNEPEEEDIDRKLTSYLSRSVTPEADPIEFHSAPKRSRQRAQPEIKPILTNMRKFNEELKPEADEFDKFGIHVAEQLRKLSLELAVQALEEIQSTLSRIRLQDIRASQNTNTH